MSAYYLEGFREGCHARDLYHAIKSAKRAAFTSRWWLIASILAAAFFAAMAAWVPAAIWAVGAAVWAVSLHFDRKDARSAEAAYAAWRKRVLSGGSE